MEQDSLHNSERILLLPTESSDLSNAEAIAIKECLSNPAVRKYLRILMQNSLEDFMMNTPTTPDDDRKLANRFLKVQGIRQAIEFLLKAPQAISAQQPQGSK